MAKDIQFDVTLSDAWRELRRIGRAVDDLEATLPAQHKSHGNEALSAKAAAKLLGISVRTLRRHADLGHIRPIRIGRRITYTRQAVEAFQREAAKGKIGVPVGGRVSK